MATDDECLRIAHEYARLAGLTKHQNVRDQLLDLARGWTAIAQHERAPFYASHHFTKTATTKMTSKALVSADDRDPTAMPKFMRSLVMCGADR